MNCFSNLQFSFRPNLMSGYQKHKKNVAILIQDQNLQKPFIATNAQTSNITLIHLAKNRHMING